jgi:hypothetical protein
VRRSPADRHARAGGEGDRHAADRSQDPGPALRLLDAGPAQSSGWRGGAAGDHASTVRWRRARGRAGPPLEREPGPLGQRLAGELAGRDRASALPTGVEHHPLRLVALALAMSRGEIAEQADKVGRALGGAGADQQPGTDRIEGAPQGAPLGPARLGRARRRAALAEPPAPVAPGADVHRQAGGARGRALAGQGQQDRAGAIRLGGAAPSAPAPAG